MNTALPRLEGPPAGRGQLAAVVALATRLGLDPDRGPRRRWGVLLDQVTAPEAAELLQALQERAAVVDPSTSLPPADSEPDGSVSSPGAANEAVEQIPAGGKGGHLGHLGPSPAGACARARAREAAELAVCDQAEPLPAPPAPAGAVEPTDRVDGADAGRGEHLAEPGGPGDVQTAPRRPGPPASPGQVRYLRRLSAETPIAVLATARRRWGIGDLAELSRPEAGELIDQVLAAAELVRRHPEEFTDPREQAHRSAQEREEEPTAGRGVHDATSAPYGAPGGPGDDEEVSPWEL